MAEIETSVQSVWTGVGAGRWEKRATESEIAITFTRHRDWLDITTRSGIAHYRTSYAYNLRDKRWRYAQEPPTTRVLTAVIAALRVELQRQDLDQKSDD